MTPETRPSLIAEICDPKNTSAWSRFKNAYAPMIEGYCRRKGLQSSDTDDVVQRVLIRVYESIDTYDRSRGRFRTWFWHKIRGEISAVLKSQSRRWSKERAFTDTDHPDEGRTTKEVGSAGEDPEFLDEYHSHIARIALEQIRPRFTKKTWEAFERVWKHDRPIRDVARDLEMTESQVSDAKRRVLERLREAVEFLCEDAAVLHR